MSNKKTSPVGPCFPAGSLSPVTAFPSGRRDFLRRMGMGLGATALSTMLSPEANLASAIDPAQAMRGR